MIMIDQSNLRVMQSVYREYCPLACSVVCSSRHVTMFSRKEGTKEDRNERKKKEGRKV